jgi:hypothetical protein
MGTPSEHPEKLAKNKVMLYYSSRILPLRFGHKIVVWKFIIWACQLWHLSQLILVFCGGDR